jgi:hypothetical protein
MENNDECIDNTLNIEKHSNNENIDNLTLELLINKNRYQKYLSMKDPEKYREYQEYHSKIKLYMEEMMQITEDLMKNPKTNFSLDITETFEKYSKSCIKYLEMKEMEKINDKKIFFNSDDIDDNEEEETLFGNIDSEREPESSKSLWGDSIVKKNNINAFTMDMFINHHKYNS